MVADFDEGRMLGELQELEDEIKAIETVLYHANWQRHIFNTNTLESLNRVLTKLQNDKDRLESRLRIRRQKVAESGVKY